jgi:hypothetical protein
VSANTLPEALARVVGLAACAWRYRYGPPLEFAGQCSDWRDISFPPPSCLRDGVSVEYAYHGESLAAALQSWRPIESAPKDGTVVDLWTADAERFTDAKWGLPDHSCGEAGIHCDSCPNVVGWHCMFGYVAECTDAPITHWRPIEGPAAIDAATKDPR